MLFNSVAFAIFLPIVFLIYWKVPHKFRWGVLLFSSYYFYMSWNIKYTILIFLVSIVTFASALIISKYDGKIKKTALIITILFCISLLVCFKYLEFVSSFIYDIVNLIGLRPTPITVKLLLPVGISFYTFQSLGYVVDVYRGKVEPERNFGIYAAFISFFPQLVAGPIERTQNLLPQIKSVKAFDYDNAIYGGRQILWGLFKKIAIADACSIYVDKAYTNLNSCSGADSLIAIFFFSMQIYCDFSGYSDIAIGSAKLFGIRLMTNFKSPYFSLSVREFWSRWHISLSTWFKDYLYIPLGGNRCSSIKNYRNIMCTFLVSGLWHGANWTFVLWGGIHGFVQVIEKAFMLDRFKTNKIKKGLSWAIVFAFCNFAWVFFRADNIKDACTMLGRLFLKMNDLDYYLHTNIGMDLGGCFFVLLMIFIVAVFDYLSLNHDIIGEIAGLKGWKKAARVIVEYGIVFLIIYSIENGVDSNQFVYFQF